MTPIRNANLVLSNLRHHFNLERLYIRKPTDQFDKAPLTESGQRIVGEAVQICLEHNVAPICSVSGEDATCDSQIFSLNQIEFDDLVNKMEGICNPKQKQIGSV
jgi:hypothetical protein